MQVKTFIAALLLSAAVAQAKPLPDGEVTQFADFSAMLTRPTTRYGHGSLGDKIEAGGFQVERKGKSLRFTLDDQHVFEYRRVRLVQLDDDAEPEAVIIRSNLKEGSGIVVFDITTDAIMLKAESKNIGTRFRWLNIVGFGDFTGRGKIEIAAVITPHLKGRLTVFELRGNQLEAVAAVNGYTNHINGTRELDLADVRDVDGDGTLDVILPRIDGSGKATVSFAQAKPRELPQ